MEECRGDSLRIVELSSKVDRLKGIVVELAVGERVSSG